jgi:hypothetical protein
VIRVNAKETTKKILSLVWLKYKIIYIFKCL